MKTLIAIASEKECEIKIISSFETWPVFFKCATKSKVYAMTSHTAASYPPSGQSCLCLEQPSLCSHLAHPFLFTFTGIDGIFSAIAD